MKEKLILKSGKRRTEGQVQPFCGPNGCKEMLRHAHYHYYSEVVKRGFPFELYMTLFLDGHQFHDEHDATKNNEHNRNLGIARHLFTFYRPLAETSFTSEYEIDYQIIIDKMTNSDDDAVHKKLPLPTFHHCVTPEMLDIIVPVVNKLRIFKRKVDKATFQSLLNCDIAEPLVSAHNRSLAYLFDKLSACGVICTNWQYTIGMREMIIKPRSNKYMSQSDLSSARTAAMCDTDREYKTEIDKMGKMIIELKGGK